jgi:uncharacterized membrane protein (DUF4010 family)
MNKLQIAIDEFLHVGIALTLIIAVIAVITGFVKEYIPQEKLQKNSKSKTKSKGLSWEQALEFLLLFVAPQWFLWLWV